MDRLFWRAAIGLLLGAILLGTAGVLRLFALDADPPVTMSSDFISDEAWWAHNARNHALFGKWVIDDFNQGLFAAPFHTAMIRLSFLVGGVTLEQTRLVSALSGLLSVALVGILLSRALGRRSALAGMAILAFDYFAISYDRVGFVEPLPTCLMTLAATLATAPRHRPLSLFVSGVVSALSVFAKANAIFFMPVLFLFLLTRPVALQVGDHRSRRRFISHDAVIYTAGALICLAAWSVAFVLPNWGEYLLENGRLRDESKIEGILLCVNLFEFGLANEVGIPSYTGFLTQALLPLMLASLWAAHNGLLICRRGLVAQAHFLSSLERLALIWIAGFLPYFVTNSNGADRRFYVFLVPLTILAVHVIGPRRRELLSFERNRGLGWSIPRTTVGVSLLALPPILYLRVPVARALHPWTETLEIGTKPGLSSTGLAALATAVLGLGCLLLSLLVFRALRKIRLRVGVIATVIVIIFLPLQSLRIARAASGLSFSLKHACEQAHCLVGDESRVVDGSALVFGTKSRNLILLDRRWAGYPFFGRRSLPSFRPTHVALGGEHSEIQFAQATRELLSGRGRYVPGTLHIFQFCPDGRGGMRFKIALGEVTPIPDGPLHRDISEGGAAATVRKPAVSRPDSAAYRRISGRNG
jgi:Dolichyl-phosphate-mannose-protein mannosyltransferase